MSKERYVTLKIKELGYMLFSFEHDIKKLEKKLNKVKNALKKEKLSAHLLDTKISYLTLLCEKDLLLETLTI